jgi:leader peptidase (prepilin peptidase)/N-methyltransferase
LLIALIDLKYRLVLNLVIYPAILLMLMVHVLALHQNILQVALGGVLAFGMFALVAWLRPSQLGGGDIKLAALVGIAFGFPHVLWVLLGAALASAAFIAYVLVTRQATLKTRMPYAPFLCAGAICGLIIMLVR